MTIILDSFEPGEAARRVDLRDTPEPLLRQLVISGSREAAQELLRRKREG